jgi:RNAse (barnase) inhibitor barstar
VPEFVIGLAEVTNPEQFYEAFFSATNGVVPDYGGRNLDALIDDLGAVEEPVTVILEDSGVAAPALGDWLDKLLGSLAIAVDRSGGLLTIVIRGATAP